MIRRVRTPAKMGRRVTVLAALALVLLGIVSCTNTKASINRRPQSGATSASAVGGVQQVTVYVDDHYRFSPDTITVHPGTVRITLVHRGKGAPHDLQVVDDPAAFIPLVQPGGSTSGSFTTPAPGRYTFVCTIHQAQGQTGVLVVLPS